jgi:hypothetical protein
LTVITVSTVTMSQWFNDVHLISPTALLVC